MMADEIQAATPRRRFPRPTARPCGPAVAGRWRPLALLALCVLMGWVSGCGGYRPGASPPFDSAQPDVHPVDVETPDAGSPDGDIPAEPAWIPLPGGTYEMGSTEGEETERPVHAVTVPAFQMTRTEVTVAQYAMCVDAGACSEPVTWIRCNWGEAGYESHPVNCVFWDQAREFCAWAGGRLPSEAEWEYAARSCGQPIEYPWGNETPTCDRTVMEEESGEGCGTGRTSAPCSRPAGNTAQGLCDMAGNVAELLEDDWHYWYYGAPDDGSAWVDEPRGQSRVFRGGSYASVAIAMRAAWRDRWYLGFMEEPNFFTGFRCAR